MRIGIDLGGTKIEGIVMNAAGKIITRHRLPTPQGEYGVTLQALAAVVDALVEKEPSASGAPIGIGMPGAVSPQTGLVKNANSVCLIGKPLENDLTSLLKRPVRLANDADCFALSEAADGAGRDYRSVFGVILGTGVGGGFVYDNNLVSGPNAIAGEWGHIQLPWMTSEELPGAQCYCGKYGCVETWLSGPGFNANNDLSLTNEEVSAHNYLSAHTPEQIKINQALDLYHDRLARGLATIINIIDPDIIVLGGGMSNIQSLYSQVPSVWGAHVFSDQVVTRLVQNQHGDSSGVRGAAWLWSADEARAISLEGANG
ncbi:MAG: ROK family protein [Parvibaculaceae bacterium]|nr:ROK family protein [Parvibaculaceae bacterium]